jgi:hypothetical protein
MGVADQLDRTPQDRWIHMKGDASAVLQFLDKKMIVVGNLGYAPPPRGSGDPQAISREHYVGYRPSRTVGVYAGKMDVAYGLRIPDHIAYSRVYTAMAQNDQSYGVLTHVALKHFEFGVHGFLGNVFQPSDLWQKGASLTFEVDVVEKFRMGMSGLVSFGSYRKRQMAGIHGRVGIGDGSAVIGEMGLIREVRTGAATETGAYLFFQSMSHLLRGFNLLVTGEAYTENMFGSALRQFRVGPGLQYFPFQQVELRVDFQSRRYWNESNVEGDSLRLMGQVGVWL